MISDNQSVYCFRAFVQYVLLLVEYTTCTLNVNKIDVVVCFLQTNTSSFLTWCTVIMSKISDKIDKFLSTYSYLFWGQFLLGHSV